jgi:hypothetical protein
VQPEGGCVLCGPTWVICTTHPDVFINDHVSSVVEDGLSIMFIANQVLNGLLC